MDESKLPPPLRYSEPRLRGGIVVILVLFCVIEASRREVDMLRICGTVRGYG